MRPLSWLVLLAAAFAAGAGPQRLSPLLARLRKVAEPPAVPTAALVGAQDSQAVAEIEGLLNGAATARTAPLSSDPSLSAEERQLLSEITPSVEVQVNPLMAAMLERSKASSAGTPRESLLEGARYVALANQTYQENQAKLVGVLWGAPALLILGGGLLALLGQKGPARALAGACHSLASKALWGMSLSALLVFASSKADLWSSLPNDLWVVPAWSILASALLLRHLDLNQPVWNSTLTSLLAPVCSCGLVLSWDSLAAATRTWLEKGA